MAETIERPHIKSEGGPIHIVLDVWDGDHHMDHVARYVGDFSALIPQILSELRAGTLVNLRGEVAWGAEDQFDDRTLSHLKEKTNG